MSTTKGYDAKVFRPYRKADQVSPFGQTYTLAGQCSACRRPVFAVVEPNGRKNEPDPRGFAGPRHSLTTFEEYPAAPFCWDCVNEHGHDGWKRCESIARNAQAVAS